MATTDHLTKNKPLPPIPEPLDRATLFETLDTFHQSLSHTRYAVSGLAALAVWGCTSRIPTRVTIMCCSSDKQVIRTWAKVCGWYVYPNQPDVIGLPSNAGQGITIIRQIRLRGVTNQEAFEWQGRVCPMGETRCDDEIIPTQATVLTPTALLNQYCENYSLSIQRSKGEVSLSSTHPDRPPQTRSEHAQRAAESAELILWILERMVKGKKQNGPEGWMPPCGDLLNLIPHVMDPRFRSAFTENYPRSVALFTQCEFGLSVLVPRGVSNERQGSVFHSDDLHTAASPSGSTKTSLIPSDAGDRSSFAISAVVANENEDEEEDILATQWQIPDDLREMMEEAELEHKAEELWK